jgi:hypothetical protein
LDDPPDSRAVMQSAVEFRVWRGTGDRPVDAQQRCEGDAAKAGGHVAEKVPARKRGRIRGGLTLEKALSPLAVEPTNRVTPAGVFSTGAKMGFRWGAPAKTATNPNHQSPASH